MPNLKHLTFGIAKLRKMLPWRARNNSTESYAWGKVKLVRWKALRYRGWSWDLGGGRQRAQKEIRKKSY